MVELSAGLAPGDQVMLDLLANGGYEAYTRYYFDWTPMKKQWLEHYAPQRNVVFLAGIGAGKTAGKGMSFLTKALSFAGYYGLNTSISSFQATLMFNMLLPYLESPKVAPFIKEVRAKPYPMITTQFESKLAFMTVGYEATNIRGSEWDEINFDEGGYERSEATIIALRGRLRGHRKIHLLDGRVLTAERLARISLTTTPTDVPWLRTRWERGLRDSTIEEPDLESYASIRATLHDNTFIPDWQKNEIIKDLPDEMIKQEIEAQFPDYGDSEFPESHVDACEDRMLNATMEQYINPMYIDENGEERPGTPEPDASYIESMRIGCTYWEMPYDRNRVYLAATDPGTSSPPKRNSAVVVVFDVTEIPYTLVYFHWVSGNGSYIPWLRSFRYAIEKYRPVLRGIDATGPQKALDELVLEREGINVDSVNFSRDKMGMLNATKMLFQRHEMRLPFIKGVRSQLRGYKIKDDDIAQDIVSTLMVFSHLTRFLPNTLPSQTSQVKIRQASYDHRKARSDRQGVGVRARR